MSFSNTNPIASSRMALVAWRGAVGLMMLAICAFLSLFAAVDAGAATFAQSFSNPAAGANVRQSVAVSSSGDASHLTKITITEPPGLGFNGPALGSSSDKCPSTSMPLYSSIFDPSSCPSQAKIGAITVELASGTATGDVYLINKSQFPWLGVDINPSSAAGNPEGLTLRFAFTSSWPYVDPSCDPETNESGWCEQQLQWASTSLQGNEIISTNFTFGTTAARGGSLSGNLFALPTDPCAVNITTKGALKAADNSVTTVLDNDWLYCAFAPTFSQTLSNPVAGQLSGVTWEWSTSPGSSNIKSLIVDSDPRIGPNIPAFGTSEDQCPSSSIPTLTSPFDVSVCPSQAKIGTITIDSPDYAGPATGDLYIVGKSPVPWLGVNIDPTTAGGNPSGLTLQFVFVPSIVQVDPSCDPETEPSGFCQSRVRIQSFGLPDVSIDTAQLVFDGPDRTGVNGTLSGKLFYLPSTDCNTPLETTARLTPFVGPVYSVTDQDSFTGC